MAEALFYISLILVAYVYAGYPLAAAALGLVRSRPVRKEPQLPAVTVVIAAYNEEEAIGATVANKLALDYPAELLDILVISDGSTDHTDEIVAGCGSGRVRLLRQEPRAGKTSALNRAIPRARGEIIVFSDANSLYAPDAVRRLVANFADGTVGYVTGRMIYANPDGTPIGQGCSAYMRYENALRAMETRIGSVVGVDGGIDAVRTTLYRPMAADQLPDFVLPLAVVSQGYRVVYEPEALLWESALKEARDEYRMRVRVSLRSLWGLYDMRHLLVPWRRSLFAWQLWSHKVLRYLCFVFLAVAYLANLLLWGKGHGYQAFFVLQNVAYLSALAMPLLESGGAGCRALTFARYFVLLNVAAAHAFGKFLRGEKQVIWTPRKG
ncbi:glycosyltransferase family 2 protein [Geobacter pickeringii]|uniref:Glycosyl transferase n=1 Tax=Geobacter pickeringii TaxID=345632 RepID=A0A0B5BEA1_9BACT|nr:glycosyltransferase family 2 protein [Geobacter pickeringii]AJE03479.1 glycosyl transferase [Geobacter pickeringii]